MEQFRLTIDEIDYKIMELLMNRMMIVEDIGKYKKQNNIPILDKNREQDINNNIEEYYLLEPHRNFIKSVFREIISKSKEIQNNL